MKHSRTWLIASTSALLAGFGTLAYVQAGGSTSQDADPSVADARIRMLHAQPFHLDRGYEHAWRAERPVVGDGWLLVIEADRALVQASNDQQPVLYAGLQTAERINSAEGGERLVVLVPAQATGAGPAALPELSGLPLWFGPAELPERLDSRAIAAELTRARSTGEAQACAASEIESALAAGGGPLHLTSRDELDLVLADLIEWHAPGEVDLVRGLRVPRR
jgi:hypothetical protein